MNWAEWVFSIIGVALISGAGIWVTAALVVLGLEKWGMIMRWTKDMLAWNNARRPTEEWVKEVMEKVDKDSNEWRQFATWRWENKWPHVIVDYVYCCPHCREGISPSSGSCIADCPGNEERKT